MHVISGKTIQSTYTITSSGCNTECRTYAHAFQIPASQVCDYGDGHQWWIFKGTTRYVPSNETTTATFTKIPLGSIKLCLFVAAYVGGSWTEYLTAEASVNETPLTVQNICSFNPGLGVRKEGKDVAPQFAGLVYWDNNGDGLPDFGAYNFEGDARVDLAFVMQAGKVTWAAFCNPPSKWINVPEYERQEHQQLQQLTPQATTQLLNILSFNPGATWVDPTPAPGSVWLNGGSYSCGPYAQSCTTYN